MKMMKKLSVLLYNDTNETEKIQKCMRSIFETSGIPVKDLQIILLNRYEEDDVNFQNGSEERIEERLRKQYGADCILITETEGMEAAQAYNEGMKLAKGEFVSFMLTSSWFDENVFQCLFDEGVPAYEVENLLSIRPEYCVSEGKGEIYTAAPRKRGLVGLKDVTVAPNMVQLILQAYVIRRTFIEGMRFREELHEEAFIEMVLKLLVKNDGRFYYNDSVIYHYSIPLENDAGFCGFAEKKWWYIDSVRNFLLIFMQEMKKKYQGHIPYYLQAVAYYLMCAKFQCNLSGNDKLMMNQQEVMTFYDLCFELLTMIDNDIIYHRGKFPLLKMPRALRMVFLKGKAQKLGYEVHVSECGNVVTCNYKIPHEDVIQSKTIVGNIGNEILEIRVINYKKGNLEIDGFFRGGAYLEKSSYELYGIIEGEKNERIEVKPSTVYGLLKCFGVSYAKKDEFHIEVPVDVLLGDGKKLAFYLKMGDTVRQLKMVFTSVNSRLLTNSKKAYWRFDRNRYMLTRWGNYLFVSKCSAWKVLKKEVLLDAVLLIQKNHKEAFTCVMMRLLYWILRPYYRRKRIWITFDKLFKAGDNGEYMFQYCQKRNDGIDCYYLINENADDCRRLKKQYPRRVLYANSWKSRLMVLNAEVILATHAGASTYLGFPVELHKYFKDLYQSDNICIQHGLSIQKIANFQNRIYANTKLYCCASPFELGNVSHPIYGYEPEMLKMTGLARYDGLRNNEQKQILITPTWRKNVVHTSGVGLKNSHSSHFKETAYFKIYNSLINDEQLIACAKENGYRIIFLLHPAMSAQLEDYDQNGFVELIQATGDMSYEKILTESSLMVTDYSGVQFDFAYQRKPLVYYHPDDLPPHYTEGGLIYKTMGFGPICTTHKQIIESLCEYMRNGCKMKKEYIERANQFFAFDDFNNAQRIYQEVLKFEKEKE